MVKEENEFLRHRYDEMWRTAEERIWRGEVEVDAVLAERRADRRRGLTLAIPPGREVRERAAEAAAALRGLEPGQYYYAPGELHVTFLSLFTATEAHAPFFARLAEYREAVEEWARHARAFPLRFAGVTASPAAIMIQGFTDSAWLNAERDRLRETMRARGLHGGMDLRYRLETAHMTLARFREPLRDARRFAKALQQLRAFAFGEMTVEHLELVRNDWYHSAQNMERVGRYALA